MTKTWSEGMKAKESSEGANSDPVPTQSNKGDRSGNGDHENSGRSLSRLIPGFLLTA